MTPTLVLAALVAAAPPVDRKQLKPGLVATLTDGTRTVTRLDPAVALGSADTPHPRLGPLAKATWAGFLRTDTPGKYTFAATGPLALKLNGEPTPLNTETPLTPGVLAFEATFAAGPGASRVELLWQGPGFRKEPVPHYLFGHLPADRPAALKADTQVEHGRFLFEELACGRCHAANTLVDRGGPTLADVGQRVYPGWLDAWLADPAKLRPHTAMPKLFADDAAGRAERYAVVQYLTSLGGPVSEPRVPSFSNEYMRTVANGQKLFVATGCAACHGASLAATNKKTDDDDDAPPPAPPVEESLYGLGTATGPQSRYALGALGSKTTPVELAKYLQDPMKANPHGRMPGMGLSETDARDLARFLCRTTDDAISKKNPAGSALEPGDIAAKHVPAADRAAFDKLGVPDQWKDLGKRLVVSRGCVNCHVVEPLKPALKAADLAALRGRSGGCVAAKPDAATVPVYALDANQRAALTAFLSDTSPLTRSPAHEARVSLRRYGCLNCHARDGEGGIGTELADQMKALASAENADDVAPPRLTGVGHKATTAWLRSVLLEGGRARPWMALRMPQYGAAHVGRLPDTLPLCEGTTSDAASPSPPVPAAKLQAGRTLAGKDGLGCVACHDMSGVAGGGTRGPDLALTTKRVRADWYARWMHNPQRLAPGTKMPQYFLDGKSTNPTVLNGDPDAQADALWAYLSLGPGLPMPSGMEPPKGLVVAVKDRPEILRTFLPDGAGSRAIAVGYPGGVNLAFDAHAARVSYAWEGNFLDAAPVWNNRGGNPAKLLGPKFLVAPPGHPWAVTTTRTPPDFLARADDPAWGKAVPNDALFPGPMKVSFAGYTLDAAGRPTFRYAADGLAVSDTPVPLKSPVAAGLGRRFAVDVPAGKTVWFLASLATKPPRLLGGAAVTETPAVGAKLVLPDGDRATLLTLTAGPPGAAWQAVKGGPGWLVLLRLPEAAGKAELALDVWPLPRDDDGLAAAVK